MREDRLTDPEAEAEERRLVEAAQKDPRRFKALYERHFARVYAYAARRLRDRAEAEDVTSEVFQQALAHLPRFEWRGAPFAAWLFQIAANATADRLARRERERGTPLPESGVDPRLEEVEELARLFRLVRRLPDDQRRGVEGGFVAQEGR